jgi:hypothetical protein
MVWTVTPYLLANRARPLAIVTDRRTVFPIAPPMGHAHSELFSLLVASFNKADIRVTFVIHLHPPVYDLP